MKFCKRENGERAVKTRRPGAGAAWRQQERKHGMVVGYGRQHVLGTKAVSAGERGLGGQSTACVAGTSGALRLDRSRAPLLGYSRNLDVN